MLVFIDQDLGGHTVLGTYVVNGVETVFVASGGATGEWECYDHTDSLVDRTIRDQIRAALFAWEDSGYNTDLAFEVEGRKVKAVYERAH